ncbi:MAG: ribonuclease H-like domain-containing protein [Thermoplasmata archaeon]|nr:MAG: ribonuclease H-like domain-containing protein [Thermoplasmata archaeon]
MSNESKSKIDSETDNVIKPIIEEKKAEVPKVEVPKLEVNSGNNGGNGWVVVNIVVAPQKPFTNDIMEYLMDKSFPRKIHPLFSKIVMIGLKKQGRTPILIYGQKEKNILNRFWKYMDKVQPDKIVTFNGYNFDVPFINIRSKMNKIQPSVEFNTTKWRMENSNHFDCMQLLSGKENFLNVALEISCRLLGVEVPDDRIRGEEIPAYHANGEVEPLKIHCVQDLEMTEQLYKRLEQ